MPNFGSAVQFNRIPALQFVAEKAPTAPANPTAGQLWTDTSVTPPKLKWYDGTAWVAADYTSLANGYITNSHVAAGAGILLSKLAVDPLARANHTGTQLAATISNFDTQVRTSRLDQLAAPTNSLDVNGQRLINVATPTLGTDGANKSYVDNSRAGISVKDPVRVVATGNVNLTTPGATIDGITMANGELFLAAGQTTGTQNGPYVYNGAAAAATRATNWDVTAEAVLGSYWIVREGTKADQFAIMTNDTAITLGTSTPAFSYISVAGASIGRFTATSPAIAGGGTWTVTHNLNSQDVHVQIRRTASPYDLVDDVYIEATSVNVVTVLPDLAMALNEFTAIVKY